MLLNDVLPNYDDPMIRIHDINLLNANLAVDILRTHTVAIIGGPGEELVLLPAATLFARNARAHRRAERGGYSQSAAPALFEHVAVDNADGSCVQQLDRATMLEVGERAAHGFDGYTKVIRNVIARNRQRDLFAISTGEARRHFEDK